jgi:hypothetical protein
MGFTWQHTQNARTPQLTAKNGVKVQKAVSYNGNFGLAAAGTAAFWSP